MFSTQSGLINKNSALYISEDNLIKVFTNNTLSLSISASQTIAIGAEATNDALLIKSTTGDCLTLTKNSINSAKFQINDAGTMTITSINTTLVNNLNISSHNGSTIGLSLAGTLITATANELNYVDTTIGTAAASKALILDSSRNIVNINDMTTDIIRARQGIFSQDISANSLALTIPLPVTSGGTGNALSVVGDILVGSGTNTYTRIAKPSYNGAIFTCESNDVKWSQSLFNYILELGDFYSITPTQYVIEYCNAKTNDNLDIIVLNSTTINTTIIGAVNGFAQSGFLGGTVKIVDTTVTGTSTTFLTDFIVGDTFTFISGESRRITAITNNTSLTVESATTYNNTWVLGTGATITPTAAIINANGLNVSAVTTARSTLTLGNRYKTTFDPPLLSEWTIEFWVRMAAVNANRLIMTTTATNVLRMVFTSTGSFITMSLGQGTSFNILNTVNLTGAVTAGVNVPIAIVCTGTAYNIYKGGVLAASVSSTLKLPASSFNSFIFGSDGTTLANSAYDEIRLSNIARYVASYTPSNTALVIDSNTIALNHFEQVTATSSDDTVQLFDQYKRGGNAPNSVAYIYAYASGYFLSARNSIAQLVDAPVSTNLCRKTGLFLSTQPAVTAIPYYTIKSGPLFTIFPTYTIIASSSSTTPVTSSLINIVPKNAKFIKVLITHTHVGTTSCGITIRGDASTSVIYLTNATAGITSMITEVPLDTNISITSNLTVAASTTSYSLILLGINI
jgi:hypothetical protein